MNKRIEKGVIKSYHLLSLCDGTIKLSSLCTIRFIMTVYQEFVYPFLITNRCMLHAISLSTFLCKCYY